MPVGEATGVNLIESGLFDVGHVSYVPISVLTSPVSLSRLTRSLDSEQTPDHSRQQDGSFDLCFAQFGHVGNVPHDRGASMFTAVALPSRHLDSLDHTLADC